MLVWQVFKRYLCVLVLKRSTVLHLLHFKCKYTVYINVFEDLWTVLHSVRTLKYTFWNLGNLQESRYESIFLLLFCHCKGKNRLILMFILVNGFSDPVNHSFSNAGYYVWSHTLAILPGIHHCISNPSDGVFYCDAVLRKRKWCDVIHGSAAASLNSLPRQETLATKGERLSFVAFNLELI